MKRFASLVLVGFLWAAGLAPAGGAPALCFGKKPTLVGTARGQVLKGTRGNDVIVGLGGTDVLKGLGGSDLLCGGTGNDHLLGGPGKDSANGGSGRDECLDVETARSCELPEPPPRIGCPPALQQAHQKREPFIEAWLDEGVAKAGEFISGVGEMKVAMVFVDFSDFPASESSQALYDRLVPPAVEFWDAASQGRMQFVVTPFHEWYRMPLPSSAYPGGASGGGGTSLEKRGYLTDAIKVTDADIDYSSYDAIAIVVSKGAMSRAGVIVANFQPGLGVVADGNELKHVQIIGGIKDQPDQPELPDAASRFSFWHDTIHWLGIPDTYYFDGVNAKHWENVGGWDLSSEVWPAPNLLAWHQWKVGWLGEGDFVCLDSPGETEVTLAPLATTGGTKAVVIPINSSEAYVAEVRADLGLDANACDHGVLIYKVDASEWNAKDNVIVQRAHATSDPGLAQKYVCGPAYNAPFDLGDGETSLFIDELHQVKIELLEKIGNDYRIRASYGGPQVDFDHDNSPVNSGPRVTSVTGSPDPFEPEAGVDLSYVLAGESAHISITIYSSSGQWIRTLQEEVLQSVGTHSVHWDGKTDAGILVVPGTYTVDVDAFGAEQEHLGNSRRGTVTAR